MDACLSGSAIDGVIVMITKTNLVLICLSVTAYVCAMQVIPAEYFDQAKTFIAQNRADLELCRPVFYAEIEKHYIDACAYIAACHEQQLVEEFFEWTRCIPVSFSFLSWSFFKTLSPDSLLKSIEALKRLRAAFGSAVLAPEARFTFGRDYTIEFIGPDVLLKSMSERIRYLSAVLLRQLSAY